MTYPSEKDLSYLPERPGYGVEVFEKAFHFYSCYLSYDMSPSKHTTIFETLSNIMQIAKLSYQGGHLLTKQEEKTLIKDLDDILEAFSNSLLRNHDLTKALQKTLHQLIDNNPLAKIVFLLMKLEYKICIYNKEEFTPAFQEDFKKLSEAALLKLSSNIPSLIAQTLCRELETFPRLLVDQENFLKKLRDSLNLLNHRY